MNPETKTVVGAVLVALALLFGGWYIGAQRSQVQVGVATPTGQQHLQLESFNAGIQIGARNATPKDFEAFGTCNLAQRVAGSFVASSTAQFFCAVSGVASGDTVRVSLPIGAGTNAYGASSLGEGFSVISSVATSSNFILVTLRNGTGAATSSFVQATTSVSYFVVSPSAR
jgi:hypothetical protein